MRVLIIIFFITLLGCTQDLPDRNALIEQYYNEKRDALLARRKRDCITSATLSAQKRVDAQIEKWINTNLFDTLNFPPKPIKPDAPEHVIDKVSKF